ncbi:MAG: glycosyltransferase [Phycisphaerae bacterium]|jgi:glycosyltransferase involved in cell wall biosynthesis
MYLVAIHVPVYVDAGCCYFETDWIRSLRLLRDSLQGRYGVLRVVAPSVDLAGGFPAQNLEAAPGADEGFEVVPSAPLHGRARSYWLSRRKWWLRDVSKHCRHADVVHTGLGDLYQPFNSDAHRCAWHAGKPIIFARDTDTVLQIESQITGQSPITAARWRVYCWLYDRCMKKMVLQAALALLKGRTLFEKYAPFAQNAKLVQDTSHLSSEVLPRHELEMRLARQQRDRGLHLVYVGRLVDRKGVHRSVNIVGRAVHRGANVRLTILGRGPEEASIARHVNEGGLRDRVRLLGPRMYGPDLLRELGQYDGLLFTPLYEDTPRMIFDGYAAGLPLIGAEIPYVRERIHEEKSGILLPMDDDERAAQLLTNLASDHQQLRELTWNAWEAGMFHAADIWYKRRAEWTFEAVERARHKARQARVSSCSCDSI